MIEREDRVLDADPQEARILGWPPRDPDTWTIHQHCKSIRINAISLEKRDRLANWSRRDSMIIREMIINFGGINKNYSWSKRIIFSYYIVIYSISGEVTRNCWRFVRGGKKSVDLLGLFSWDSKRTLKSYIIDRDLSGNILPFLANITIIHLAMEQ